MPIPLLRDVAVRALFILSAGAILAACQVRTASEAPIPRQVLERIAAIGSTPASPIYIRLFKEESEFEIWKRRSDGTYALLDTYEICTYSGVLGPKLQEGDRQAPEGFYAVTPAQMNPNSVEHLSFNIGFPNAFDQALGRTGSHLMVHGGCSSAGCYAMTDEVVEIIYALAREAFRGGQRSFAIHAFPFRMTPENLARHVDNPNFDFWLMLKEGYDHFEVTRRVPEVAVCDYRYVFNADAGDAAFEPTEACPSYTIPSDIQVALEARQQAEGLAFQAALLRLRGEGEILTGAITGPYTPVPAN